MLYLLGHGSDISSKMAYVDDEHGRYSLLLAVTPHRFRSLTRIGTVAFIFDLVLFPIFTGSLLDVSWNLYQLCQPLDREPLDSSM